MARYRRAMALRPINRIKHVVDGSATLAKNTKLNQTLIVTTDAPVLANTSEVETGSKVNGIYLKVEVASNEAQVIGAIPNVYMAIMKVPTGIVTMKPNDVGDNANKRFVIHQEMVMIENTGKGGNSRVLFNGVIKIPKTYIRNAPLDQLMLVIFAPALDIVLCWQAHYKEFR